jgi:hypothetical protein
VWDPHVRVFFNLSVPAGEIERERDWEGGSLSASELRPMSSGPSGRPAAGELQSRSRGPLAASSPSRGLAPSAVGSPSRGPAPPAAGRGLHRPQVPPAVGELLRPRALRASSSPGGRPPGSSPVAAM